MIKLLTKDVEIANGYTEARRKTFDYNFPLHWHDFFEIEFFISGSGNYIINNSLYPIKPGMIFFTNPSSFHEMTEIKNVTLYTINFTLDACNSTILSDFCLNKPYCAFQNDSKSMVFLEAVMDELIKNLNNKEIASIMLDCILAKISTNTAENFDQPHNDKSSAIKKAQLFILNNFRGDVSLESTAKNVGLTSSYLSHLFTKEINMSFKEYVNNVRFEYVEKLLKYTNMNTIQICSESGFNDYPNFSRRFKKRFGTSPQKYRRDFIKEKKEKTEKTENK